MNCREAEKWIAIEREGALGDSRRAALDAHLSSCASCREQRAELAAAVQTWKAADAKVELPNVETEWHAIRRRMRNTEKPSVAWFPGWLAPALGVAAIAVIALVIAGPWTFSPDVPSATVARAEYVEVADESASTLVYVDEESGWLVVWAVSPTAEAGT